jgi:hypothetical protein
MTKEEHDNLVLQEENERLKEENKHIFANVNDDELLISNAMNYAEAQDYKSRIDKANEILGGILVVRDWEHKGKYRPVKNTTRQDVYKTICILNEILETPYRIDYEILGDDNNAKD